MALTQHREGTVKCAHKFNPTADCQAIQNALKGFTTDGKAIIEVLAHRSYPQREEIKMEYQTLYGENLGEELDSELSGHFNQLCQGLLLPLVQYDALELKNSMNDDGLDEKMLIEILCSRNNAHIQQLKDAYSKLNAGSSLENDICDDTDSQFKSLLVSLLQARRDESACVDIQAAQKDAHLLSKAGEKLLGSDESLFNQILCTRSEAYLNVIFTEYQKVAGKTIEEAIKSEMSGELCKSMLTLVRCLQNKPAYFAHSLYNCMHGIGTKDNELVRIVLTRCEIDMVQIKHEFERIYSKTLASYIKGDTSGSYKRMLLALIGERES